MSQSGLLQRRREENQKYLEMGSKYGYQKACDFIAMALNDPDILGSRILSGEVIDKVITAAGEASDLYYKAYSPSDPEADVWQERLDAIQKKIFKERFQPFYERYPWLKKIKYGKRRK